MIYLISCNVFASSSGSLHLEDLESDTSSRQRASVDATMNTTLRFPIRNTDDIQVKMTGTQPPSDLTAQPVTMDTSLQQAQMSGIAQELQVIVRQELRKIMQVIIEHNSGKLFRAISFQM